MSLSQDAVIRALNSYVYETTYNAPADECGVNLQLYLVSPRFVTNTIISGNLSLALPVAGTQYAIFWANYVLFEDSLIIPENTWISTDIIGQVHQTLFHVYSETGLMVPKSSVFVYRATGSSRVYIAVVKAPLVAIVGMTNWQQLYLSIYRYSASSNRPLTISSSQIASPDPGQSSAGAVTAAIATAMSLVPKGTFVYINGYDHIPSSTIVLSPGDYVDIYTDTTVIDLFTVPLTTADPTGYFSSLYQVYKEVLHCPKATNPTNLIFTPEMLTLTARRNTDHIGCFIHRNETNGLTQITHNDVGINTSIVNAYRTTLVPTGTIADILIEVRIRSHNNHLILESSYIEYLYLNNDATILTFLTGHGDPTLPFWTAAALEQSVYVTDMANPPSLITPQTLATYVNSLGSYSTLAALCLYAKTYTINQLPVTAISVKKPLVLSGLAVYPMVYLNGTKLRDTQVDYVNGHQDKIIFSLTPDVYAQVGQSLTVEMLESGSSIPYLFTPTSGTPTLTVPFRGLTIYQVNTLTTSVVGYLTSATKSYTQLIPGPGAVMQTTVSGDTTTLLFQPGSYGTTYLIQNATFSRCYGQDVTSQVTALTPVHIELTTLCQDGSTIVPLLGYQTLEVYLNGRRMIEGIDFSAVPIADTSNNAAIVQILVCNKSVLSTTGSNYLEVIAHTAVDLGHSVGYVTNNTINIRNNTEMWYNGLSEAFSNGYLLINPTDGGDKLTPAVTITNGTPFLITATIPNFVLKALSSISSVADDERLVLINAYLNAQAPINDNSFLIIPNSWKVYSPYLTAIIHDVTQPGQLLEYTNDPDPVLFKRQFAAYDYLLNNDPTLTSNISAIDLRYCDVYPTYTTVNVPDLNTYTILRRLAGLLLSPDSDTLGDVTND